MFPSIFRGTQGKSKELEASFSSSHHSGAGPFTKTSETPMGLRQYFPKGSDLSVYSQEDLDYVAWEMNDRPRKRLDYLKPNEMIEPLLLR